MIKIITRSWIRLPLMLALCVWLSPAMQAQEFRKMLQDPANHNLEEIKTAAETHFDREGKGKGSGYKQYMRWQWFMEGRQDESGRLQNPRVRNFDEAQKFREFNTVSGKALSSNGNWLAKGPRNYNTAGEGTGPGLGRLNTMALDPSNSNKIYVGAADGGLWRTTNNGLTWVPLTDGLANLGVSGIAIHPTNTNIIYILTGDGPGDFSTLWPSIHNTGVLKSTNGGSTWQSTGLSFNAPNASRGHRLLMNPSSPQYMLVATSSGIYYTSNSGVSWTKRVTGKFRSMEFKPNNPTVVYASTETDFYKSTNRGFTWTKITSSTLPAVGTRTLIGVSPNQPNWVYLAYSSATSSGRFLGLYRSTDSGATWTQRANSSVNLFGLDITGSGSFGVGDYAAAITVSPTNANVVDIAALIHWRSTDGGSNFTIQSFWDTDEAATNGLDYAHGDFHFLQYKSNGDLFGCNDGGFWLKPNSASSRWTDRSAGLEITQIYRLGENSTQSTPVYIGTQDNGMFKYNGSSTFTHTWIGDVMDVGVNQNNTNTIYAERFSGQLYRSTDAGLTYIATPMVNPTFNWINPVEVDPNNGNTLYTVDRNNIVQRSTNAAVSFSPRNNVARPTVDIECAKSNSNVVYACDKTQIWRSINGGASWTVATGNLALIKEAIISDLEIDDTNVNRVWLTCQGYNGSQKVFVTTNGGSTWTSLSAGLPNVPINAVVHEHGSANGIYVGTDIGVWYRDDNTAGWVDFNNGLPSVVVLDLEIYQTGSRLRAGTFGRGYWESDLYTASTCPPSLNLTGNVTSSNTFEARDFITSTQRISGSVTQVVYDADDYIQLNVGFETVAGLRSFETRLIGCSSNKAQPITGIYEGPMPGVAIPYELPAAESADLGLRLAPNPGNDLVSFIFHLPEDGKASLALYTLTGEKISDVVTDREYSAGEYRIRHDVSELANGIYFVKISNGRSQKTERLVILH